MFRTLFTAVSFLLFTSHSVFASDEVELQIHNVDQGHCSTLRVKNQETGNVNYLLVDVGSSSHKKEFIYTKQQAALEEETETVSSPLTFVQEHLKAPSPPYSAKKPSDFRATLEEPEYGEGENEEKVEKSFIQELRNTLIEQGATRRKEEKKVKKKKRKAKKKRYLLSI